MSLKFLQGLLLVVIHVSNGVGQNHSLRAVFPRKFGRNMRSDFALNYNYVGLNSGSYGAYPNPVRKEVEKLRESALANFDLWERNTVKTEIAKARRVLGELMNCDEDDLVMIPNTTGGFNAVLRNIKFNKGDRILHLTSIYFSIEGVLKYILDQNKGILSQLTLDIEYPMSNNDVVVKLERFLNETHDPAKPIRIAVIDHISSLPTILNPIDKMIPLLKRYNIPVIVDGAHAIGQVKVDIRKLDPDFYVGGVHKWGMAPAPTAVLYVKKEHQDSIHPVIVSKYYRAHADYQKEFWWTGTWDNLNYAAVPIAFEYRRRLGGEEKIMDYNNKLAVQGGTLVARMLGTRVLQERDQMAAMVDVQLPLKNPEDPKYTEDYWIDLQLARHHNCFVVIYKQSGQWWARLSAQIYNDITDFGKGAQHLLNVIKDAESWSSRGNPVDEDGLVAGTKMD